MADDGREKRVHPRVMVSLILRVKYANTDQFVDQFATNVSSGGLFIQSRNPHPPGTFVRFEIQLKGGQTILRGKGQVAWSRPPFPPGKKPQVPGMGIKFLDLDDASKKLVNRILDQKGLSGAAPPASAKKAEGAAPSPKREVAQEAGKPRQQAARAVVPAPAPTPVVPKAPAPSAADAALDDLDVTVDEPPAAPLVDELDGMDVAIEAPPPPPAPKVEVSDELKRGEDEERSDFEVDISVDEPPGPPELKIEARAPVAVPPTYSGAAQSKVIGIDLGTTNSCAAVVINGRPQVIPSRKGHRTLPSIVAYDDRGRLLVGQAAKAQMELNPTNTVYGSKRLVGRPYGSPAVQQIKDRFQYEIIEGPNHQAAVRIVGREFSLQQVAAFVLSEIRDIAREYLKEEVNRAVITVPAYYNENQRQAVREAGTLAGFNVERIVNEPTAAALAFGYNRGLDQRVMVYDLGGGTFDASVLELCGNVYEVVATGGDVFLGGVDFDNQVVDYLMETFFQQIGSIPKLDRSAMQRLRDAAELAKCALSEKQETIVRIPFFAKVNDAPKDLEVQVTRALLEELVSPLVERTIAVAERVLQQAGLDANHLDTLVLVGGQSRMPLVWNRIREVFGKEPHKGVHPDEAVAVGAALLADSLDKLDSVVLIDVLPMSIGIGLPGGAFAKVLEAGTALPTNRVCKFRTFADNQTVMELHIFQGESERLVDCEYLGTVMISGITPALRGTVQLVVNLALNQECLLMVTCRELPTGKLNETHMAERESTDILRRKLQIPEQETYAEKIGVPESLRRAARKDAPRKQAPSERVSGEGKPPDGMGLLGKLFGRRKP